MGLKKYILNKVRTYAIICIFSVFLFYGTVAHAATLTINSSSATLSPGNITTLSVVLNSEGVAINNAEAKIVFPTEFLEVVSVNKGGSIFSLWVEEPSYSNITGIISFNGGVPTPGFTGASGSVLSVVVKAKKAGQVDLLFADAAVRANDGFGTDVLRSNVGKTLSITKQEEVVSEVISTSPVNSLYTTLQVTSPTHPSQELWYRDTSPLYRWVVPSGVDAVQTGIDNTTSGLPRVTFSPPISERTVKDLKDGIWYFKVRARQGGEWGPVSTYIARVDNTIPKKNNVTFSYDDTNRVLSIDADILDETSGLEYYELYINNAFFKKILSTEFVNGKYVIPYKISGEHSVKLVAVDRAGNSVESLGKFNVTVVEEAVIPSVQVAPSVREPLVITIGTFVVPVTYFIILILSGGLLLVLGSFKIGRRYGNLHSVFRVRTALVKGDNTKVLLLLKKRLEKHLEILQNTRHTRILSKEEKEIKEAIEGDLDEVDRAIEEQKVAQ